MSKDVFLNTRVEAARFDEAQGCWILETDSDTDFEATYIIVCAGFASKPYIPDLPGLEKFSGPLIIPLFGRKMGSILQVKNRSDRDWC